MSPTRREILLLNFIQSIFGEVAEDAKDLDESMQGMHAEIKGCTYPSRQTSKPLQFRTDPALPNTSLVRSRRRSALQFEGRTARRRSHRC